MQFDMVLLSGPPYRIRLPIYGINLKVLQSVLMPPVKDPLRRRQGSETTK